MRNLINLHGVDQGKFRPEHPSNVEFATISLLGLPLPFGFSRGDRCKEFV